MDKEKRKKERGQTHTLKVMNPDAKKMRALLPLTAAAAQIKPSRVADQWGGLVRGHTADEKEQPEALVGHRQLR